MFVLRLQTYSQIEYVLFQDPAVNTAANPYTHTGHGNFKKLDAVLSHSRKFHLERSEKDRWVQVVGLC